MKWLPATRSNKNPCFCKNRTTSRGLTAGSFGILEIQGGNQRLVVAWDGVPVLPEALDIAGYGVLRHFLGFGQGASIRHATRQGRHHGRKSPLRFGTQD